MYNVIDVWVYLYIKKLTYMYVWYILASRPIGNIYIKELLIIMQKLYSSIYFTINTSMKTMNKT